MISSNNECGSPATMPRTFRVRFEVSQTSLRKRGRTLWISNE